MSGEKPSLLDRWLGRLSSAGALLQTKLGAAIVTVIGGLGLALGAFLLEALSGTKTVGALVLMITGWWIGAGLYMAIRPLARVTVPLKWCGLRYWVTFSRVRRTVLDVAAPECWKCRYPAEWDGDLPTVVLRCVQCGKHYATLDSDDQDAVRSLLEAQLRHGQRPWKRGYRFATDVEKERPWSPR